MHLGVLAIAWHAISTGTMFTVYYKPRTSPVEFIVPYNKYMESTKNNYSVGMRFKMRFEGEEAPEQRTKLSDHIDLKETLWGAEALCISTGEDGKACIPPATTPSG